MNQLIRYGGTSIRLSLTMILVVMAAFSQLQVSWLRDDLSSQVERTVALEQLASHQSKQVSNAEAKTKEIYEICKDMAIKCSKLAELYQAERRAALQCLANQSLLTSGG